MADFDNTFPRNTPAQQGSRPSNIPSTEPEGARAVRTFMVAMTTEKGPRLYAFRISDLLIGRLPDNHLALNHSSVSRRHAKISVTNRGVIIEDMGSQNGTTLNGVAVNGSKPVRPGDIIRIGHVPLYYFGFINIDTPPVPELVENTIMVNPLLPQLT